MEKRPMSLSDAIHIAMNNLEDRAASEVKINRDFEAEMKVAMDMEVNQCFAIHTALDKVEENETEKAMWVPYDKFREIAGMDVDCIPAKEARYAFFKDGVSDLLLDVEKARDEAQDLWIDSDEFRSWLVKRKSGSWQCVNSAMKEVYSHLDSAMFWLNIILEKEDK